LLVTAIIAFVIMYAWRYPPHRRLNDGLLRLLRRVVYQGYVGLLLILFGFCFDVARAADLPLSKTYLKPAVVFDLGLYHPGGGVVH